jgi:prepilin-type N-terminal cleavage/methylation domain-containing protein
MRRDAGFTLIEMIVSLAIVSLFLVALFRGASDGMGNAETADRYLRATIIARSRMAESIALPTIAPGQTGGIEGGYSWQRIVRIKAGPETAALYEMEVSVSWPNRQHRRTVSLISYRLSPSRQDPAR